MGNLTTHAISGCCLSTHCVFLQHLTLLINNKFTGCSSVSGYSLHNTAFLTALAQVNTNFYSDLNY